MRGLGALMKSANPRRRSCATLAGDLECPPPRSVRRDRGRRGTSRSLSRGSRRFLDRSSSDGARLLDDARSPWAGGRITEADSPPSYAGSTTDWCGWRRRRRRAELPPLLRVNRLAGLRAETPRSSTSAHRRWRAGRRGPLDGLRIDHPDGLADPDEYLEDGWRAHPRRGLVVEKILEPPISCLPLEWPRAPPATTAADVDRFSSTRPPSPPGPAVRRPAARRASRPYDGQSSGGPAPDHDVDPASPRSAARGSAPATDSRGRRRATRSPKCSPRFRSTAPTCRRAARRPEGLRAERAAQPPVRRTRPEPPCSPPSSGACRTPTQLRGPLPADLRQWPWPRASRTPRSYQLQPPGPLTEVGGDPHRVRRGAREFHADGPAAGRAAAPMTTLSTHDTKRTEDVRAPGICAHSPRSPAHWRQPNRPRNVGAAAGRSLSALLWQVLVGAWPARRERRGLRDEGRARSRKLDHVDRPDEAFEEALHAVRRRRFDNPAVRAQSKSPRGTRWSPTARVDSSLAKLLQLTTPGVPDVYQGTELWDRR